MTEVEKSNAGRWEKLLEQLSKKVEQNINQTELETLLLEYGLENVETLAFRFQSKSSQTPTPKEKEDIVNQMNKLANESQLTEDEAKELGRKLNEGMLNKYIKARKDKRERSSN